MAGESKHHLYRDNHIILNQLSPNIDVAAIQSALEDVWGDVCSSKIAVYEPTQLNGPSRGIVASLKKFKESAKS